MIIIELNIYLIVSLVVWGLCLYLCLGLCLGLYFVLFLFCFWVCILFQLFLRLNLCMVWDLNFMVEFSFGIILGLHFDFILVMFYFGFKYKCIVLFCI